jgi:hypothetical protein
MKDLDQKIIELMDLFDDEQITTADQIDRPERAIEKQAIDDFVKRNPMAGGGMLVQPGFGGMRQGYKGNKTYPFKRPDGKTDYRLGLDEDTGKYFKKIGKEDNIRTITQDEGESIEDFRKRKAERVTKINDATVKARQYVDNWTKNWFDNNLKKYGINSFDVMMDDLSSAWQLQLESGDVPKGKGSFNLSTPQLKLPNITTLADTKGKSNLTPFKYNGVIFYKNLEGTDELRNKTLAQFKKVFYKNQINNNPQLQKDLIKFFNFMSADKRGQYKKLDGKTIKDFMNTEVSNEVKFLLNSKISGLDKASKKEVFNSYPDLADNYNKYTEDKVRLRAVQAETEAIAKAGEKTAEQYKKVKADIAKQNDVLAKMTIKDIANDKELLNSVRMSINPQTGEVSYTNYTVNDPKGKPALTDLELAQKIKQKAKNKNFYVTEHIGKKSLNKANLAFPNNIQSANYMSNAQLENARRFLMIPENRNTPAAQNLDKTLENFKLTIRGPEYGNKRIGNKMDIVFDSKTGVSNIVQNQSLLPLAKIGCPNQKADGGRVNFFNGGDVVSCAVRGLNKVKNTSPEKLGPIEKSNIKSFTKTASGARLLKNVLGPTALAYEGLFALPFAAYDFASGRPGEDILKNTLSLGFLDQKLYEDELKQKFPDYGKAEYLMDFDKRLLEMERQMGGTKGQKRRVKPKLKTTLEKFETDPTRLEFATMDDPAAGIFDNYLKSIQAVQDVEQDRAALAEERKSPFDFSYGDMSTDNRAGFTLGGYGKDAAKYIKEIETDHHKGYQYYKKHGGKKSFKDYVKTSMSKYFAGGGIAKLAGVDSGPAPESGPNPQGLQALMKRGIKT